MIKYREDMKKCIDLIKNTESNEHLEFIIEYCKSQIRFNDIIESFNKKDNYDDKNLLDIYSQLICKQPKCIGKISDIF